MKPRILFDFQTFTSQRYGGISRYFYELLQEYHRHGQVDAELALRYSDNVYLKQATFFDKSNWLTDCPQKDFQTFIPQLSFPGKGRLFRLLQGMGMYQYPQQYPTQYSSNPRNFTPYHYYRNYDVNADYAINLVKMGNFDLLHPTYFDTYFLPYLGDKPFVLTVYDMIHELYPEYVPAGDMITKLKKILVRKAAKVIAISETTKQDIINILHVPENKIAVTYLASPYKPITKDKNKPEPSDQPRNFVYIGMRIGYKNFNLFLKALSVFLQQDRHLNLMCAGWEPFTKEEKHLFKQLDIDQQVIHVPVVSDHQMRQIYLQAYALVIPSLYEGFGLPVLEAMGCGCPVIASQKASIPEIGGNALLYFQPTSTKSIRNAIYTFIHSSTLRNEMMVKGLRQNQKFSWSKTADQTAEIYQEVLRDVAR